MSKKIAIALFVLNLILSVGTLQAVTGVGTYRFLDVPFSAKLSGLGGENVSVQSDDVNQFYTNPALFTPSLKNRLSLSYVNYMADANGGAISYAYAMDTLNYFGFNFIFMGYGDLQGYDEYGVSTGGFSSGEFAWNLVYARYLGAGIKLGVSLKPVYSHIENYSSFGFAFDCGANYYKPEWDFSVGLSVRNFGFRCKSYCEGQGRERLPWNVQLGVTKGLQHAPFRFSVTYDHLNDWNFDYERPRRNEIWGGTTEEEKKAPEIKGVDMFFRHMIFAMEVIVKKNFHFDVAYNHRRNREGYLTEARGINGFSFGAGFRVYKFFIDAAYAQNAPAAGQFSLSLSTCVDSFKKNKE